METVWVVMPTVLGGLRLVSNSLPDAPGAVTAAPAASILLLRQTHELEVLMVRRHQDLTFAGGALVFPGGRVQDDDDSAHWGDHVAPGEGTPDLTFRLAAVRELFEEAGVLLACPPIAENLPIEVRAAVASGRTSFADLIRSLQVVLGVANLRPLSRWITPPVASKRFDTWFFLALAPDEAKPSADGVETVDVEWLQPTTALQLAAAGERKIHFATRMNLKRLAAFTSAASALEDSNATMADPVEPIVFSRGGQRFIKLDPAAGYGEVEEPFALS